MKTSQLGALMCALSVCSVAWSATNDVKGIDIIIKKKPNGGASLHADQISSNSATAASRAVATKGISGNISANGDVDVVNTSTESVDNTSSVSADITSDGDLDYTEANTKTNTINNENTGGNVVTSTHLRTVVSGNSVLVDGRSLDNTEAAVAVMGNSIGSNAFEGVTGVTVINMNDGHNSNVQSAISIIAIPE